MRSNCRVYEPSFGGVLYARGSYSEGGSYMPINTVDAVESHNFRVRDGGTIARHRIEYVFSSRPLW
jgi:hypothetical protein